MSNVNSVTLQTQIALHYCWPTLSQKFSLYFVNINHIKNILKMLWTPNKVYILLRKVIFWTICCF
jgi:hypothetical protein